MVALSVFQESKMMTTGDFMTNTPQTNNPQDVSESERMGALIESISAYIEHYHGGAVKMVGFDGQTLQVAMSGACDGCALAPVTLHGWVEGTVKQFFPTVERVEAV
jgi:Fe-S cluster biogenesis protein NfuA